MPTNHRLIPVEASHHYWLFEVMLVTVWTWKEKHVSFWNNSPIITTICHTHSGRDLLTPPPPPHLLDWLTEPHHSCHTYQSHWRDWLTPVVTHSTLLGLTHIISVTHTDISLYQLSQSNNWLTSFLSCITQQHLTHINSVTHIRHNWPHHLSHHSGDWPTSFLPHVSHKAWWTSPCQSATHIA